MPQTNVCSRWDPEEARCRIGEAALQVIEAQQALELCVNFGNIINSTAGTDLADLKPSSLTCSDLRNCGNDYFYPLDSVNNKKSEGTRNGSIFVIQHARHTMNRGGNEAATSASLIFSEEKMKPRRRGSLDNPTARSTISTTCGARRRQSLDSAVVSRSDGTSAGSGSRLASGPHEEIKKGRNSERSKPDASLAMQLVPLPNSGHLAGSEAGSDFGPAPKG